MSKTRKVLLATLLFTATASFSNAANPQAVNFEGSSPMCMPLDPKCEIWPDTK